MHSSREFVGKNEKYATMWPDIPIKQEEKMTIWQYYNWSREALILETASSISASVMVRGGAILKA